MSSDSVFDLYTVDSDLEKGGIVCQYADVKFTIARSGGANIAFRKVFEAESKPYKRQIDTRTLSDEDGLRMVAKVYAKAVILHVACKKRDDAGKIVVDEAGEPVWLEDMIPLKDVVGPVPASVENVVKFLVSLPEVFVDLQRMSTDATNYRKAEDEEDEGN